VENRTIKEQLEELKRTKLRLLEQKKLYMSTHQMEFFEPQEQQKPFFDALIDQNLDQYCILGGNRSGKSEALVVAVCSFIVGRFQWVPVPTPLPQPRSISYTDTQLIAKWEDETRTFDAEIREGKVIKADRIFNEWLAEQNRDKVKLRFKGPLKVRVLGEDYEKAIGQTLIPKFNKFLPPELIASRRKGQTGVYNQFILHDGSVIDFLTYQQTSDSMEGWDGHIVAYDEPPPRPVYIANARGLIDHRGVSLFAMTPLKEPWIADEIVSSTSKTTRTFVFRTFENPHIDQNAAKEFEAKLSEEERKTRIDGEFLHLQGLVFKEFDKQQHVIKPIDIPNQWTVYVGIDTHPRTQQALLFVAVDQRNQFYAIHEVFQHGTPEDVANWVTNFHRTIHPIHAAVVEPASQGDQNRGDTTFQIIERGLSVESIPVYLGSKDLSGGILQLRQVLRTPNRRPALFIFDHLDRLIFEFTHYVWEDWKTTSGGVKNERQRPRDKDDHLIECLRRLIQHPAQFVDPRAISSWVQQANQPAQASDKLAGY
jgi:hypothetical protein